MDRRAKNLILVSAITVLLLGGVAAAVTATTQHSRSGSSARAALRAARRFGGRDLATAAGYIGVSRAQLRGELKAGKTLAQVAQQSGRSVQGLIGSLIAAKQARLAALASSLPRRVASEVNRAGGPRSLHPRVRARMRRRALARARAHHRAPPRAAGARNPFAAPAFLGYPAAAYLGISATALQAQVLAGRTLAEIASASSGKSQAGLIEALVAARKQRLAAAVGAGTITAGREAATLRGLQRRASALVNRVFARQRSR